MTTRTRLKARLEKKQELLDKLYTTYDELISDGTESYRFDSGDGSQQAKKRKLAEVKSQIDQLESEIDSLCRRLAGKGLTNIALRRRGCGRNY